MDRGRRARSVEEINRRNAPSAPALNFGWPCYEGPGPQEGFQSLDLNICKDLYAEPGAVRSPFFSYGHDAQVVPGESCPSGSSSLSGMAFYTEGPYPTEYDGALFFADYSRNCIWAMERAGSGAPSPTRIKTFVAPATNPVDLEVGRDGNLYYVDFDGGTVRRIAYPAGNYVPNPVAQATPTSGSVPLTVISTRPGRPIAIQMTPSYTWDLDGNGTYGDSTASRPRFTYRSAGVYPVHLRVTDSRGASATDTLAISAGNTPPTPTITAPESSRKWAVGDPITFSGSAVDTRMGACRPRRFPGHWSCTTAPRLPHSTGSVSSRACEAGPSTRRATATLRIWSCGSSQPIPGGSSAPRPSAWSQRLRISP